MIARPIPPGATVIAKPVVPGIPAVRSHAQQQALPIPDQIVPDNVKNSFAPKVMVWNRHHPYGQLMPLRQPDPAVYFQHGQ